MSATTAEEDRATTVYLSFVLLLIEVRITRIHFQGNRSNLTRDEARYISSKQMP